MSYVSPLRQMERNEVFLLKDGVFRRCGTLILDLALYDIKTGLYELVAGYGGAIILGHLDKAVMQHKLGRFDLAFLIC